MPPNKLSVIIITHNEERLLPDCLKSIAQWVDEIIILDHNSTDKTCHIAKMAGAHIYHSVTWQGFGKQKQLAQKYATGDYILSLDADERISTQLKESILSTIKKKIDKNTVYAFARRSLFLNYWMKHSGWYPDFVIRLYPKKYSYNSMKVHESLNIKHATVKNLKGDLLHITCQYLPKFQKKQLQYAEIWALEHFKYNKKKYNLFIIILHSVVTFLKILLFNAGFLDGKYGVILAIIKSQYTFNKYIILWTLLQKRKNKSCKYLPNK